MCLILFSFKQHKEYPLVIAANRDEFYSRPTKAASFWEDNPHVLAGRDLEKMGTWMGVTKKGNFAALTNYRSGTNVKPHLQSRGELVSTFLVEEPTMEEYRNKLEATSSNYDGYNLIFGNSEAIYYYSNVSNSYKELLPGVYGLSNKYLDTNWPKVEKGKVQLVECLNKKSLDYECLFQILKDDEVASDEQLPDTGVGIHLERLLSPLFIKSESYGTRTSTLFTVNKDKTVEYVERTVEKEPIHEKRFSFQMES